MLRQDATCGRERLALPNLVVHAGFDATTSPAKVPFPSRVGKSVSILDDESLLVTCAYIDLNPITPDVAPHPARSSHAVQSNSDRYFSSYVKRLFNDIVSDFLDHAQKKTLIRWVKSFESGNLGVIVRHVMRHGALGQRPAVVVTSTSHPSLNAEFMTMETVIDANQAQPKSGSGARFNAVTHGLTAKVAVLPNEDPEAFLAMVQDFKESLQTRTPLEEDLVQKAAEASWRMSRASRAEVARINRSMDTERLEAEYREEDEAKVLWERLFFNRQGPAELYGAKPYYRDLRPRTSVPEPGVSTDPDSPDRLVADLESTRAGCRLLLKGWADLGSLIETRQGWGSYDKFRCTRLMGKQPLKVFSVPEVTEMFLACYAIAPLYQNAYQELRCELEEDEFKYLFAVMCQKELEAITPADATAGRAVLRRIVDNATERLRTLEARHQQVADNHQRLRPDILGVEDTKTGDGIRRLQTACNRSYLQNLNAFHNGRRNSCVGVGEHKGAERTKKRRARRQLQRPPSPGESRRYTIGPGRRGVRSKRLELHREPRRRSGPLRGPARAPGGRTERPLAPRNR